MKFNYQVDKLQNRQMEQESLYDTLLLRTDEYKYSHFLQYRPGVNRLAAYVSPRANNLLPDVDIDIVSFGVQAFILKYLTKRITAEQVLRAEKIVKKTGLPFNTAGFMRIVNENGGLFPVQVYAIPEGGQIKPGQIQAQVITAPGWNEPWVTTFIETALVRAIWYPSTVATLSREIKKVINRYLQLSSDDPAGQLPFKLHDFGARATTSGESAEIGGSAHLINFCGTDTTESLLNIEKYYLLNDDLTTYPGLLGGSIPAAEHSTITSWGKLREDAALSNLIDQFAANGIFAGVSDSYDIYNACENIWGGSLRQKVIDSKATVVVRPDSGNPLVVLPRIMAIFEDKFGVTYNSKGYKLLNNVRIIWGDGINYQMINDILYLLVNKLGYSADNIAFGMGSALLQNISRDSLSYAMKGSAGQLEANSFWYGFNKDPVTAPEKASLRGIHSMYSDDGIKDWTQMNQMYDGTPPWTGKIPWNLVYDNGTINNLSDFGDVRKRAAL